jgi:hypothetical protein
MFTTPAPHPSPTTPDDRVVRYDSREALWHGVQNAVITSEDLDEKFRLLFGHKPKPGEPPMSPTSGRSPQRLRNAVASCSQRNEKPPPFQQQKRPRRPFSADVALNGDATDVVVATMGREIAALEEENRKLSQQNRALQPLQRQVAILDSLVTGFCKIRVHEKARGKENA